MFPSLNTGRLPGFTRNKSSPPLQSSVAQIPVEHFKLAAGKRTGVGRLVVERRRQIVPLLRECLDKSTLCRLQRRLPHGRKPWPPSKCTHPSFPVPSPTQPPLKCLRSQVYGTYPQSFYSIYKANVSTPCTVNDLLRTHTTSLWRRLSQRI